MDTAITTTGAGSAPTAPITAADQTRIDDALRDPRAANTRAQYHSAWRGWAAWCADHGHQAMPPIRWPSPPTLPSAPSGAPPILRRMMASAASCRNDCSHYWRAVRVARGPVNPGAPLPQGAGTVPSSPRSALRPVAGRASVAARVGRYAGGPPTGTGAGASRSMAPVRGRRISALSGGAPSQSNSNLWRVSEMI